MSGGNNKKNIGVFELPFDKLKPPPRYSFIRNESNTKDNTILSLPLTSNPVKLNVSDKQQPVQKHNQTPKIGCEELDVIVSTNCMDGSPENTNPHPQVLMHQVTQPVQTTTLLNESVDWMMGLDSLPEIAADQMDQDFFDFFYEAENQIFINRLTQSEVSNLPLTNLNQLHQTCPYASPDQESTLMDGIKLQEIQQNPIDNFFDDYVDQIDSLLTETVNQEDPGEIQISTKQRLHSEVTLSPCLNQLQQSFSNAPPLKEINTLDDLLELML